MTLEFGLVLAQPRRGATDFVAVIAKLAEAPFDVVALIAVFLINFAAHFGITRLKATVVALNA